MSIIISPNILDGKKKTRMICNPHYIYHETCQPVSLKTGWRHSMTLDFDFSAWWSKALHILMRAAFSSTRMPSPWWRLNFHFFTDGSAQLSSQAKQARIKVFADHQLCALRLAGQLANVLGKLKLPMTQRLDVSCTSGMKHQLDVRSTKIWPIPACQFLWSQILEFRYHFDCGFLFAQQTLCPQVSMFLWLEMYEATFPHPFPMFQALLFQKFIELLSSKQIRYHPISLAPPPNKGRHRPPNGCREKHAWPVSPLWASASEKRAENDFHRPSLTQQWKKGGIPYQKWCLHNI